VGFLSTLAGRYAADRMRLEQPTLMDLLMLCADMRQDEIEQYEAFVGDWNESDAASDFYNRPGVQFVLLNEQEVPVCAGGWDPIIEGVYHAWMLGTMQYWEKYWRSITKHTKRVMDTMLKNNARRLQAGVLLSRTDTCDWFVRGLGMHHEGSYDNFGRKGETLAIFARLKESENG